MKKNIFIPLLFLTVMITACSNDAKKESTANTDTVAETTTVAPTTTEAPTTQETTTEAAVIKEEIYSITEGGKKIMYIPIPSSISSLMRLPTVTRCKAETILHR